MAKNFMTPQAAARIQSAQAKSNGGIVSRNSHASRSQSAAARNVNTGVVKK